MNHSHELSKNINNRDPLISIRKPSCKWKVPSVLAADYIIKGYDWTIWVYPDTMKVKLGLNSSYTKTAGFDYLHNRHWKPLYDILGSGGNPTMAMLYKEYMEIIPVSMNLTTLENFPTKVIWVQIQLLVYIMIYEPWKIKWVDDEEKLFFPKCQFDKF